MSARKVALLILDGLGLAPEAAAGNAVTPRTMPFLHSLMSRFGHAALEASGPAVGLDEGQPGNSEVGHLTIGAGRIVGSALSRVEAAYKSGEWSRSALWSALAAAQRVHVAGLLSDAGVHAHWRSLQRAAELAKAAGAGEVIVHAFLDGVDSPRGSAPALLASLRAALAPLAGVRLGTISGRQWACDRGGNQSLTGACVDGLTGYDELPGFTVERLTSHLESSGEASFSFHAFTPLSSLKAGEPIVLTHHRADRIRQLAAALSEITPTFSLVELDGAVPRERVFFPLQPLRGGLADTLNAAGLPLHRLAESCKYPHVTFFLDGMRETGAPAVEVPSIPESEIAAHPAMSLHALVDGIAARMADPDARVLVANLANLDQVGHTGDLGAALKAAGIVDGELARLWAQAEAHGWTFVLIADHGNADRMLDDNGRPLPSHSTNLVPLVVADPRGLAPALTSQSGSLANVAPTVLTLLGLAPPAEMAPALVAFA